MGNCSGIFGNCTGEGDAQQNAVKRVDSQHMAQALKANEAARMTG